MASCPNCGRRTMRTKDWVCQWCGYPLLGGGYKQIDKTFKELQEERSPWRSVKPEPEPAFDFETRPQPEPERMPENRPEMKKAPKPSYRLKPEPAPGPVPEAEMPPEPPAAPQPAPVPSPERGPELLPRPEPGPVMLSGPGEQAWPETGSAVEPQPMITPPPEPREPPERETPSESLTVPGLDSIQDGTELTIDQIDALFQADRLGASSAMRDKTLIIKGMVNKVFIRDHLDVRYLMLTGNRKAVWSIRCQFEKESSPQMSRLSEGQPIALRGKYDGFSKNIIFKECVLVD
jgi:hypothetical protein